MADEEVSGAVMLMSDLHKEATNYLHSRSELSKTAQIARIAYLMGEMKAPLKVLLARCPPEDER